MLKTECLVDVIENNIREALPSGSGFDYEYTIDWLKSGKCTVFGRYTIYNEVGYRLGAVGFNCTFYVHDIDNSFNLYYCENSHIDKSNAKDYISDTMFEHLTDGL